MAIGLCKSKHDVTEGTWYFLVLLKVKTEFEIEFYYFLHETSEKKHPPGLHFIFPPPIVTIKMIPNLRSLCCFWQMIKLGVIPPLGTRETAAWIIQQQTEWLLKCEKETLLALPGKEADATKKNRLLFISLSSSSRDVSPPFFGARNLCTCMKRNEERWGGFNTFFHLTYFLLDSGTILNNECCLL